MNIMTQFFVPDKHKRIRQNHDKKRKKRPTTNQETPRIWSPTIFKPKLTDTTLYYTVNPKKQVNIKEVQIKLIELYGFDVKVYPQIFNCFDVLLGKRTDWATVQKITLKLLEDYE